jgi:aldehyde:ferredoxin oxidoreductase
LSNISQLQLLSAVTGWNYSQEDLQKQVGRIYTVEKLFNLRDGFGKKDDTLPFRSLAEPIPDGPAKGNVVPLDEMLSEYYLLRGWDESGKPKKETLEELGLGEFISLL